MLESSLACLCVRGTKIQDHLPVFECGYLLFLCYCVYYKSHSNILYESTVLFYVQSKAHSQYYLVFKVSSGS